MAFEVVVVGAGPCGLMLACELALGGVRVLVVERRTGANPEQRANGMVGQVVRVMDRRGLFERLGGKGVPRPAPSFMFAAFPLDLSGLAPNPLYTMLAPQQRVEEVLAARAGELGVDLRFGHDVVSMEQTGESVVLDVDGPDGRYRAEAAYVVGADGGRSLIRKLAGVEFPGVTRDDTVSRTAHVSVPKEFLDRRTGGLKLPGYGVIAPFLHHRNERGLVAWAPFPGRAALLSVSERRPVDESVPFGPAELREAFERVVGVDLPIAAPAGPGPHLMRRLTGGNTRLAARYRAGRVLLVGDAAHVHSAIGGQGLNLGLQDAVNLGWKLAGAVRGWAPDDLLDSYETERRPVGQRVTMQTEAQGVLVGPGPAVSALRTLFGELLQDPGTVRRIAELISGADIRYPHTSGWAPDMTVDSGRGPVRLAELMRTGRPLLLDLTVSATESAARASGNSASGPAGAHSMGGRLAAVRFARRALAATGSGGAGRRGSRSPANGTATGGLAEIAQPWRDRVDIVTGHSDDAPSAGMLIRPDGYVAWDPASAEPLTAALTRWWGTGLS